MLLVGSIVVLLLMLWWCRRHEKREGMMSDSCSLLANEQSNSDKPIPFCATGAVFKNATKCKAAQSGRCRKPYKYPICSGNLEYEDGVCV